MAEATRRMLDAAQLKAESRVLDVGTGTGETAIQAAERIGPKGRVIAIDASAPMLEQAKTNIRNSGMTNVEVRQMDGAHLELEDASVDAVIGRNAMQFLPRWPDPLRGFRRVLRPAGRLSFIVWAPKAVNAFIDLPVSLAVEHGLMRVPAPSLEGPYALDNAGRLRTDLASCGFRDVSVEEVVGEAQFQDGGALVSYLRDGPMYRRNYDELDELDRRRFDEAITAAVERFRVGDGYRVQATSLLVTASR
jgi:SAM-dependent methyltransferase